MTHGAAPTQSITQSATHKPCDKGHGTGPRVKLGDDAGDASTHRPRPPSHAAQTTEQVLGSSLRMTRGDVPTHSITHSAPHKPCDTGHGAVLGVKPEDDAGGCAHTQAMPTPSPATKATEQVLGSSPRMTRGDAPTQSTTHKPCDTGHGTDLGVKPGDDAWGCAHTKPLHTAAHTSLSTKATR
jgi:hypothetical protein